MEQNFRPRNKKDVRNDKHNLEENNLVQSALLSGKANGQMWLFEDEGAQGISANECKLEKSSLPHEQSILLEFLVSSLSAETRKIYKIELTLFFKYLIDNHLSTKECDIGKLHVLAYRDQLLKNNYAYKTIRRKLSIINSYFNYLVDREVINKNHCTLKNKEMPRDQIVRPTNALTDEEAFKILDLAKTHHQDERMRIFHYSVLSIFLGTGMRKAELMGLKGSSYIETDGIFCLRVLGKGGKIREIPLTAKSKEALDNYLEMMKKNNRKVNAADPIFQPQMSNDISDVNLCRPCSKILIEKIVKRYCDLGGINKRISAHSLRATTITHLREQDADIYAIAQVAGHASTETTKKYIKRADELRKSAVFKSKF